MIDRDRYAKDLTTLEEWLRLHPQSTHSQIKEGTGFSYGRIRDLLVDPRFVKEKVSPPYTWKLREVQSEDS